MVDIRSPCRDRILVPRRRDRGADPRELSRIETEKALEGALGLTQLEHRLEDGGLLLRPLVESLQVVHSRGLPEIQQLFLDFGRLAPQAQVAALQLSEILSLI